MSRYVDANGLKQTFCAECSHSIKCEDCDIEYHFEHFPTADVVEVKHGRNICDSVIGHCEFKCSVCGADALSVSCGSLDGGKFNYCPNCGAEMKND